MATQTKWKYLERDPMSSQRQLSVKGRRIKARTLAGRVLSAEEPRTVEEVAADYNVPVEAVRESLEYVQSAPPELRQDFAFEEAIVELSGANDPKNQGRAVHFVDPVIKARIRREISGDTELS